MWSRIYAFIRMYPFKFAKLWIFAILKLIDLVDKCEIWLKTEDKKYFAHLICLDKSLHNVAKYFLVTFENTFQLSFFNCKLENESWKLSSEILDVSKLKNYKSHSRRIELAYQWKIQIFNVQVCPITTNFLLVQRSESIPSNHEYPEYQNI